MDRLPFRLYRERAYIDLVMLCDVGDDVVKTARRLFRLGTASGRKPQVWAAAVVRVCVLERQHGAVLSGKGPVMDVSQRDLAQFYGVTDVAIRNTARVLRKEL